MVEDVWASECGRDRDTADGGGGEGRIPGGLRDKKDRMADRRRGAADPTEL